MRAVRTLLLASLLALLACGSGGGSSNQRAGGGVGGTGISSGSVTGFGSFFVTDTEWSLAPLGTVEIDGETGDAGGAFGEGDLRLGMYLEVEGDRSNDGSSGDALSVRYDEAIRGAVEQLPVDLGPDQRIFTILGQMVVMDLRRTVFEGTDFDTLAAGDVVEVSGPRTSDGSVLATRIELEGVLVLGVTQVELKGSVAAPTGNLSGSFEIGPVVVSFDCTATTDCSDLPGGEVSEAQSVEVEGVQTGAGASPEVGALRVRAFRSFADALEDGPNLEVEGPIDDFAGLGSFRVNGVSVDASAAELDPNTPSLYLDGAYVEVEGDVEGGVLVARRVELEDGVARVSARIPSGGLARRGQGELLMLTDGAEGVVVEVVASTRIEDKSGGDDDLDFSELLVGDYLEIRGVVLGPGRMRATEIERDDVDRIELRGPAESVDTNPAGGVGYMALGVFVEMVQGITNVDETGDDVAAFLAGLVIGEVVQARDDEDGSEDRFDIADDVERE